MYHPQSNQFGIFSVVSQINVPEPNVKIVQVSLILVYHHRQSTMATFRSIFSYTYLSPTYHIPITYLSPTDHLPITYLISFHTWHYWPPRHSIHDITDHRNIPYTTSLTTATFRTWHHWPPQHSIHDITDHRDILYNTFDIARSSYRMSTCCWTSYRMSRLSLQK